MSVTIIVGVYTVLFVFHSYDDFRSSVVSSDDIGGHHERLVSSSSQTKVQDLHNNNNMYMFDAISMEQN